ncbi:MAG TPA: hypothetical protein VIW24_20100 [Aldersonia sp.]
MKGGYPLHWSAFEIIESAAFQIGAINSMSSRRHVLPYPSSADRRAVGEAQSHLSNERMFAFP